MEVGTIENGAYNDVQRQISEEFKGLNVLLHLRKATNEVRMIVTRPFPTKSMVIDLKGDGFDFAKIEDKESFITDKIREIKEFFNITGLGF